MKTKRPNPFEIQGQIKDRMTAKGYKLEYGVEASPYNCRVTRPDGTVFIVNVASLENALLPQDNHIAKPMEAFWKSLDEHIFDVPKEKTGTEAEEEET